MLSPQHVLEQLGIPLDALDDEQSLVPLLLRLALRLYRTEEALEEAIDTLVHRSALPKGAPSMH